MAEYTFNNVLIDPNKEGIESLIGKEVYFHDNPSVCLMKANEGSSTMSGILSEIRKDSINPFCIKCNNHIYGYSCIIERKEEPKPKYVPFKNVDEFLNGYSHVETKNLDNAHRYLYSQGIWLKEKGTDSGIFCMVLEFQKDGAFVGHADVVLGCEAAYTRFTPWSKLYQEYTFLDGSPCGKLEEDECQ